MLLALLDEDGDGVVSTDEFMRQMYDLKNIVVGTTTFYVLKRVEKIGAQMAKLAKQLSRQGKCLERIESATRGSTSAHDASSIPACRLDTRATGTAIDLVGSRLTHIAEEADAAAKRNQGENLLWQGQTEAIERLDRHASEMIIRRQGDDIKRKLEGIANMAGIHEVQLAGLARSVEHWTKSLLDAASSEEKVHEAGLRDFIEARSSAFVNLVQTNYKMDLDVHTQPTSPSTLNIDVPSQHTYHDSPKLSAGEVFFPP